MLPTFCEWKTKREILVLERGDKFKTFSSPSKTRSSTCSLVFGSDTSRGTVGLVELVSQLAPNYGVVADPDYTGFASVKIIN